MQVLPLNIEQREEHFSRLGIKSSLSNISSIVSLTYALYCANGKKDEVIYADEQVQENGKKKLVLKSVFVEWLKKHYTINETVINNNPLLTSQLEALQVGLGLMFHLAKISYVDYPNTDTKERTGGERYRKLLRFSANIKLLDIYLSTWPADELKSEMSLWLNNSPSNSKLSVGLKSILTIFVEDTLLKIRSQGKEVIFQPIGIYEKLSDGNSVIAKDEQEDVGPFRIFKSFVREGLHPFIKLSDNAFLKGDNADFDTYKNMVETTLSLSPKKIALYQEIQENEKHKIENNFTKSNIPLQQIFYGAPGTGKSHTINEVTKGEDVIRTTFHPDTDYSSFVGAYKPTMSLLPICNEIGEPMKIANQALYKEQIVYEFVTQSFLQAYISAWWKYAEAAEGEAKKQFLVIEEINRGNCAQIFGDLFQLLDRNDRGFSEYPIKADADMKKQLKKAFKGLDVQQRDGINAMFGGRDVVSGVLDGDLLLLPDNLYIWATMNTSDQSLFPIDSAFKRRWDWTYIPISNAGKGWTVNIGGARYDWWQFVESINGLIGRTTNSEDKKLGYFFCKAADGVISADTFVGKVIFYLWNDVFKDYDFCDQAFNDADGEKLTFDKFYTAEGGGSKVVGEKVEMFLKNLKLEPVNDIAEQEEFAGQEADEPDSPISKQNQKDYTRYSINGEGDYPKKDVATELVKKYIGMNPGISAGDVVRNWRKLGIPVPHFIETEAEYADRKDSSKRSNRIECNGDAVYVTWNGWGGPERMKELKEAVSKQDWGLDIQEKAQ